MTKNKRLSAVLFSSLLLTSSLTFPVLALDAKSYLEQLETQAKARNGTFKYDSVDESSDGTAIIKGFSYVVKDTIVTAQEITFNNAEIIGTNGFKFESMTGNNISVTGKSTKGSDVTVAIQNIKANQFLLPDMADRKTPIWPLNMDKAFMKNVSITTNRPDQNITINIPEIQLSNLANKGGKNFNLGSFKTSKITSITQSNGSDIQMAFGGVELSGLEYFGLFGIQLDSFTFGDFILGGTNKKKDKFDINFAGMDIKNLYLPDAQDEDRPLIPEKVLLMKFGQLKVAINDGDVMGWEKGYATNITDPEKGFVEGSGTLDGMYIDFGKLPSKPGDKQKLQALFDLGYEKITMGLAAKGTWNTNTGIVDMSQYKLDIEDAGAFDIAMVISGYTPELAREISRISNQSNFETDPQKLKALNLQLLAKMTALSFDKLQLKIEDDSLLNKVVGLQAEKLNQEPEQITGIVGPMASIVLAPYNIPQFAASLGQALTTFMQGNKSITVLANPEKPVALTEIIALGSGAQAGTIQPADLIERLNVTVSAE